MSKRTFKEDKLAKIYDAEVVPIWSRRFGRMLLRDLVVPNKAMVLDTNCGSGYPSLDLLKRMDEAGRIIAIDTSSPLLDEARTKAGKLSGKRIFFRSEASLPKLPFAEQVYDLVISNAGLQQIDDPEPAIRECARVTKVGGEVVATYPLAGTFGEFYDILREVLIKGDYKDAIDRLDAYLTRYPPLEQAAAWFEDAGLSDVRVEYESFELLFKSSREFFFAPIIEYGPLSNWKAIAGKGQQMQDVFWQTKASIDAYFSGRAFSVTVHAGCVRGRKLAREESEQAPSPREVEKGVRASSNPQSRRSGSSRKVEAPTEELPDAPSDEVEALSGSWPIPEPELRNDNEQSRSEIVLNPSDPDEPDTGLVPRVALSDLSGLADKLEPELPTPSADDDEEVLSAEEHGEILDDAPAITNLDSGEMILGTGEIELIEDTDEPEEDAPATEGKHVRRVRRPDEPDDPDIL
ncbi:MAG: methyltransferase domain-containing protein [Polyangia bacterium]